MPFGGLFSRFGFGNSRRNARFQQGLQDRDMLGQRLGLRYDDDEIRSWMRYTPGAYPSRGGPNYGIYPQSRGYFSNGVGAYHNRRFARPGWAREPVMSGGLGYGSVISSYMNAGGRAYYDPLVRERPRYGGYGNYGGSYYSSYY